MLDAVTFVISNSSSGRVSLRKKRRVPISFGVEHANNQGFTHDLSETGVFICTDELFYPGLKLRVLVETHEGNLSLEGKVVWICDDRHPSNSPHEAGMGLQWLATDEQYLDYYQML